MQHITNTEIATIKWHDLLDACNSKFTLSEEFDTGELKFGPLTFDLLINQTSDGNLYTISTLNELYKSRTRFTYRELKMHVLKCTYEHYNKLKSIFEIEKPLESSVTDIDEILYSCKNIRIDIESKINKKKNM